MCIGTNCDGSQLPTVVAPLNVRVINMTAAASGYVRVVEDNAAAGYATYFGTFVPAGVKHGCPSCRCV